jgi:D-aminoacyl-tRNA deacylase
MVEEKIALVYSVLDEAGKLIAQKIKEAGVPSWAHFYEVEDDIIFASLSKVKENKVVFLSRHQSEAGTKSLTVHMLGNFSEAKYGGKSRDFCHALARVGANYLRGLDRRTKEFELDKKGFSVCYEVTHHGPHTNKECLFIEIGSSLTDWKNPLAAEVVARTVVEDTLKENNDTIVIGLGGGHYAPDFTKLVLRQPYAFGHICPKHHLSELSLDMVGAMIRKSKASEIILDWKGLKENKEKVVKLCETMKLPTQRVQTLLK